MVNITIYSKNGLEKATVKSLEYDGTFMGDRYVTVSVSSPTVINWAIGDYLEYRGERWSLWLLPATSKVARANTYGGAFEYKDLRFCPTEEELRRCSFLDVVLSDNEIHYTSLPNFSFYCATAKDLADRIQANLDRLYPGAWTITANPAASITDQSLTFTNNSCWDALTMANSSLDLNFTIDSANRSIVIGGEGAFIETVMDYGQGHGLKSIERTVDSNQQVINRLYAYGNTRNLPYRYYNKRYGADSPIFDEVQSMYLPNLMLPGICKGWGASEAASHLDANGNVKEAYGSEGQALTYNHSTFWYDNPDGSRYVGTVYLFYRHFSLNEDRTTYYCDRVWIESESSINKCGIQEGVKFFDGSDELVDDIYPSITGFDSTEALAEAVGSAIAAEQNLNFEQGELDEVLGFTVDSWDGIIPEEQETTPTFYIRIKNIGFDMSDAELDASGDTPRLSMKSGMCTGREFNILECKKQVFAYGSWQDYNPSAPVSGPWSYRLKCEVAADESIGQYFPNRNFTLAVGDKFVILGIKMPDIYVDVAERRLLKSAIIWLSENDKTAYNYSPAINNIYMSENPETSSLLKEGNVLHIYDADLDINVEMTISQLKIKNDKQIPEYEVTLSNDKEADLVQRITAQVHQSFTQFIGNGKGGGSNIYLIGTTSTVAPTDNNAYSARRSLQMFLRKDIDDIAAGKITFNDLSTFLGGANYGVYEPGGFLGAGAHVGADGRGEFEEITVRGVLRAAELVFNRISAEEGEAIRSIGHGEILSVDESSLTATLKLEGDEWATIDVGDICRGLYNTIDKDYDNADSEGEDANGFRNKPGFFASYFKVEEILESGKGECSFRYSLQPGTTEHPCELMKFAVYGNTDNTKKERQSCMYITAVGIAPRLLFLAGVNDWQIKPQNIKAALGNLEGLQVYEKSGDSVVLKQLHGDAGLFVEDNVYLGGVIEQFIHANLDDILAELGQGIHAELTRGSDNIVVDALGNIVGGIYNEYDGGNRHYRLHTGVLVYDSGKKRYLTPASGNTIGENEFAVYHNCEGCDVIRDGADFYVTNIHNTNDGISDTTLTDAELELMRSTEECKVNFTIVTHNGWRTIISYPIRITHLDHGYITFSLDNEFDSIAYRTQTKKYDGLPIDTHIRGYVNGSEVSVVSTSVKTNFATSDMSEETITADDNSVQTRYFRNDASSGVKMELTKAGKLTLKAYTKSSDDIDYDDTFYYFDIKSVVKYAGVSYESAWRRFTLTEITDSTLYKLLLSATAVSKDEGVFTPSSVDVKVQVTNNNGTSVAVPDEYGNIAGIAGIKVRYLKGVYSPNGTNNWLTSMPSFADPSVTTCVTVACVDMSGNHPLVLDVQSITINAVGKDGAGQPYVKTNIDQYVVDCNSNGDVLANNDPLTIEAELYWGDNKCGLTNSQCYIKYNGSTLPHDYNSIGESISVSISFAQGQSLSSSNVEISLVGSDGGGDVHSAIKTIAIIANRQGNQGEGGNDGNGIDQVTTYYLLTTKYADVTTSDTGWAAQFAEPTAEFPYLWRFTRYTYTEDGAMPYDTPCELIKTYYTEDNPNLLVDALFLADSMGAWDKKGALSSAVEVADDFAPVFSTASTYNTQTNGHRQFRGYFKAKNTNGYITLLSQYVYRDDLLSKVEESQWYTLSFLLYGTRSDQTNADFILAADVSQIADSSSSAKVFIDGQEMSASAAYKNFTVTDTFTRHTMTFKTKSSLSGNLSVVWYMHPRTYTQDVYISEPKLEFGKVATRFSASPFSIEPLTRTSKWRLGMDYQAGQKGEKYLDIVEYNDGWYKCQKSHISTNNNKPNDAVQSTEYWFKANQFEFVATNLLLADRAAINLLSSNVINLFNSSGVKTASINADGNGEYCIHYPTGGKCLTFSYDRFIHCYREDGSEAWRIGLGGDIEKFTSPDFINFPLCSLSGRSGAISQSDTFTMTNTYWRYRSGNASGLAQYDGKIYDSGSATVAPTNPATATAIPDGRYTPDTRSHQVVDSMDVGKYAIIVYVIEDGFVKQTLELTEL